MNLRKLILKSISLLTVAGLFLGVAHIFDRVQSADLTDASVILSTPRFSFYGATSGSHAAGSTIITLESSGYPSTSPQNLFNGDTVTFDPGGTPFTETVLSADEDDSSFSITNGLDSLAADDTGIMVPRTTTLKVRFTTASAVTDGQFKVRVPAGTSTGSGTDGIPDSDGWDARDGTLSNVTVTCPDSDDTTGDYTFGASSKTTGGGYHTFTCPYTGAGGIESFDGSDGDTDTNLKEMQISGLYNPTPNGGTEGEADAYPILIYHETTGGGSVVDQSSVSVAVIESVKVTASVQPQITFTIAGVSSGQSVCGYASTSIGTNPFEVEFGDLLTGAFKTAAQQMTVSTNAGGGYVVTALAGDQLHRAGVTCTGDDADTDGDGIADPVSGCIPDSVGDGSAMTPSNEDEWANTSTKGFGFTLQGGATTGADANNEPTMAFESNAGGGSCAGSDCHRQFADNQAGEVAQTLFSNNDTVSGDLAYVCYQAVIDTQQEAGSDYETDITYRATATF